MKLIKVMAGIYRSESGAVRVVDRYWERRGSDERWLIEWSTMTLPGIFEKRQKYVRSFKEARLFVSSLEAAS